MNTTQIIQLAVTSAGLCFSGLSCCINLILTVNVFWLKRLKSSKKTSDLSLIYRRFAVDSIYTFLTFLNMLYLIIKKLNPSFSVFGYRNALFFISLPNFNFGSIRALLVLLISLDRILATCFPIFYRNYRSRIGNQMILSLIVLFVLSSELSILFGYCQYVLDIPEGCVAFNCVVNQCYFQYWLISEQILYSTTGVLSILLCSRIFFWTNGESQKSQDLVRANRIALLDTFIVFSFDLLPAFLLKYVNAIFGNIGPMSAVSKNIGFVLEGCIICKVMVCRKSAIGASTISIQGSK